LLFCSHSLRYRRGRRSVSLHSRRPLRFAELTRSIPFNRPRRKLQTRRRASVTRTASPSRHGRRRTRPLCGRSRFVPASTAFGSALAAVAVGQVADVSSAATNRKLLRQRRPLRAPSRNRRLPRTDYTHLPTAKDPTDSPLQPPPPAPPASTALLSYTSLLSPTPLGISARPFASSLQLTLFVSPSARSRPPPKRQRSSACCMSERYYLSAVIARRLRSDSEISL
jgi:hypothetical protein